MHLSQRSNQSINQPRNKSAYILFLVHLPYSINKEIIINVFYRPWHQHYIIWVMDMRRNIKSGVSKSVFRRFRIRVKFTSALIFFWDITKKNVKILNYRIEEWHTSTLYDICWNISNYPTVSLLLVMSYRTNHCITVFVK